MDNLLKIKKFSQSFHFIISLLLVVIPLYYVGYWLLINHLPDTLITVNTPSTPLINNKHVRHIFNLSAQLDILFSKNCRTSKTSVQALHATSLRFYTPSRKWEPLRIINRINP